MANPLMVALRARYDLKESVLHTAQEIAARTSIYGVVRVSYSYLATKCHCCRQTIINHIKILIERRVLRKTVLWIKNNFCEVNTYTFTIPLKRDTAQTCNSQNSRQNLPHQEKREKFGSLREEIAGLQKGLQVCTVGSIAYEATRDKIARLTILLRGD